jgi:hypothetical protein
VETKSVANLKSILENTTNAALLVVCSLLAWLFLTHHDLLLNGRQDPAPESQALLGKTLPPLPDHDWKRQNPTLVMAIREGCTFCEASMPFYKRLSDLRKADRIRARLLAIMPDPEAEASAQLQAKGVNVEGAFHQPLKSLYVSATPTLLLVNGEGKVVRAWVGQLTPQQESEVVSAVH